MQQISFDKPALNQTSSATGYSVIELAAVIAILAIIAGISIPAFVNIFKSSRIDGAKSILNTAIAKCLQNYRSDPDNAETASVTEEVLAGLEQAGYKVVSGKEKCSDFMIAPSDPEENYLFSMGFMVRNGGVTKVAIPASDQGSENACKSWGTCGIPPELRDEWDRLAKIEADKKACNDAFYAFLNSGNNGQKNAWDDASQSCSRAQWVLDGTRYTSKDAYDAAFTAKVGKECIAELTAYSESNPPNGKYINEKCNIDTHFLNGINLETSDPVVYESKLREYNVQQCNAAELKWISEGKDGMFTWPEELSCTVKWKCNKSIFNDEESYQSSPCGTPPEPPPPPRCLFRSGGRCVLWG